MDGKLTSITHHHSNQVLSALHGFRGAWRMPRALDAMDSMTACGMDDEVNAPPDRAEHRSIGKRCEPHWIRKQSIRS